MKGFSSGKKNINHLRSYLGRQKFLHTIWCNKDSYTSYGTFLCQKQAHLDPALKDYGYIEYFPERRNEILLNDTKFHESKRDYFTASLRQVNHLIQIGKPNLELTEPKWELYKVSISFERIRKFYIFIDLCINSLP